MGVFFTQFIGRNLLEGRIRMSERGPEIKTIRLVAANPRYSIFSVNLVTRENNYCEKPIKVNIHSRFDSKH